MKTSSYRLTSLLLLAILTVALISACNTNITTSVARPKQLIESCRVVQHMMGKTCIPRNPQRVVTASALENTLALSIKPIASTFILGYPLPRHLQGKVDGVENVGNFNQPNIEKILRLKPDLILSDSQLSNIYKQLSYIAPTVVLSRSFPPRPWRQELENIAQVLGKEEASKKLIDEYWQRIQKLQLALGNRRQQMKISVVNMSPESGIWAYGEKHPAGTVLTEIGLQRPPAQRGDFFYINNISEENLLDIDGDVLFFLSYGRKDDKKVLEKLRKRPLWQQLKVVQRNHVYFVDAGDWHNSNLLSINVILDDLFKYLVDTP
jgi:iron complex transport system substrate-binding protein